MKVSLGLPPIQTLDELVERSQRGHVAKTAIEYIRDKLAALRDDTYRKLLNASTPDKVMELRADLRAIERLAQSILVDQAQGEIAYRALYEVVPPTEDSGPAAPGRAAAKKGQPVRSGSG